MELTTICFGCGKDLTVQTIELGICGLTFKAACPDCSNANLPFAYGIDYWEYNIIYDSYPKLCISLEIMKLISKVNNTVYDCTDSHYSGLNLISVFCDDMLDIDPKNTIESLENAINKWIKNVSH